MHVCLHVGIWEEHLPHNDSEKCAKRHRGGSQLGGNAGWHGCVSALCWHRLCHPAGECCYSSCIILGTAIGGVAGALHFAYVCSAAHGNADGDEDGKGTADGSGWS